MPVGITPQEHNGSGMPKSAVLTADRQLFCPMYRSIHLLGNQTFRMPAKRNPNKRYGAIEFSNSINE
jgi:hypothetical protein